MLCVKAEFFYPVEGTMEEEKSGRNQWKLKTVYKKNMSKFSLDLVSLFNHLQILILMWFYLLFLSKVDIFTAMLSDDICSTLTHHSEHFILELSIAQGRLKEWANHFHRWLCTKQNVFLQYVRKLDYRDKHRILTLSLGMKVTEVELWILCIKYI